MARRLNIVDTSAWRRAPSRLVFCKLNKIGLEVMYETAHRRVSIDDERASLASEIDHLWEINSGKRALTADNCAAASNDPKTTSDPDTVGVCVLGYGRRTLTRLRFLKPSVENYEQTGECSGEASACSRESQTKTPGNEIRFFRVELFREGSRKTFESVSGARANLRQPFPPERATSASVRLNADRMENCELTGG